MLAIRFFRRGRKNQPFYKIVVTDKRNPPQGGRFLESLGFYNPLTKERKLNPQRVQYWLSVGAQPSETIHNLLIKEGIIKGKKIAAHKKRKEDRKEPKEAEKTGKDKTPQSPNEQTLTKV